MLKINFVIHFIGLFSISENLQNFNFFNEMKEKPKNVRVIFDGIFSVENEFFSCVCKHSTVEIFELEKIDSATMTQSNFNFILSNSTKLVEKFLENLNEKKFLISGFYLIFTKNCSTIDRQKIFDIAWKKYIINIDILCESKDNELSIDTFLPFQNHLSCGNTSSVQIHNQQEIFPRKTRNFHTCPIKVATFFYPPITMRETLANNSYRYYGSEMDLVFGLAEALNFTIDMNYANRGGLAGLLLDNGTATGFIRQTIDGDVDMLMGFYYLTLLRTQYMSFTDSHYSIPLVIMIPFGRPYS